MSADPYTLAGKRILITGASSGIGRGTAVACARRGATLVLSGRNQERLDQTLASLDGTGHSVFPVDLTDLSQIAALADHCAQINGMFFSAGIASNAPFRMITEKHLRGLMAVDFEAPIFLTQRLVQRKQIAKGGSIVFNTAGAARNSPAGAAIYSAAKAALYAAVRSLALEVGRDKIRVTCLQLGYVKTEMLQGLGNSGIDLNERSDLMPLGIGEVDDVANAVIFLLCDASRWISRTALTVDGGVSIRISAAQ